MLCESLAGLTLVDGIPYDCPYMEVVVMAVKADRMEARVSVDERTRIERAASVAGLSVSAFVVGAAVDRADTILAEANTTMVPVDYFDALLAALDVPAPAPRLARASLSAQRSQQILTR